MTFLENQQAAKRARDERLGKTPPRKNVIQFPIKEDLGTTTTSFPVIVTTGVPVIEIVAPIADETVEPVEIVAPREYAEKLNDLRNEVLALNRRLSTLIMEDEKPIFVTSPVKPIALAVAKFYGITLAEMVSPRKTASIVFPRQVAMYLAREMSGHSLPAIGRVLQRDHSSVIHGANKIEGLLPVCSKLASEINQIRSIIEASNV